MADDRPTRGTPRSLLSSLASHAQPSAVVPVLPDDQLDAVAAKVRASGAQQVQLLIPEGAAVFRSARSFRVLRALLSDSSPQLQVISGDPRTLGAAREAGMDTLGLETGGVSRAPRPAGGAVTQPIDDKDAAFLRDLDRVGDDDADLYASLDDLSDTIEDSHHAGRREADEADDLAASLDDLPDAPPAPRRQTGAREPAPSRPVRAATGAARADSSVRVRSAGAAREPVSAPRPAATGRTVPATSTYQPAGLRISPTVIALGVIALLVVAGIVWAASARVTVWVSPPVGEAGQVPFQNEIIPHAPDAGGENAIAVQAAPVVAEATYTISGMVAAETLSPVGRAKGQVRIINTLEQPVDLLEGTQFIGTNAAGSEVRFLIDAPTTVPPAVTTVSEAGRSTRYGEIVVDISARSAGSASNLGENAITQLVIPAQQPYVSDRSNFLLRNAPIGGGTEEPQRIVTDAEVQSVLTDALTGLYNVGLQDLQAQVTQQRLTVDASTVTPNTTDLANPASYEVVEVKPPIGSPVDAANPSFTMTLRARFSALATPAAASVGEQLKIVVGNHFRDPAHRRCGPGDSSAATDVTWRWTGEALTINGYVACTPPQDVPPETLAVVRSALVGQSREAAEASLRQYQQLGVIGGFELPDRDEMPPLELLLEVKVRQPEAP